MHVLYLVPGVNCLIVQGVLFSFAVMHYYVLSLQRPPSSSGNLSSYNQAEDAQSTRSGDTPGPNSQPTHNSGHTPGDNNSETGLSGWLAGS